MKNIFDMLKPGGDILFTIISSTPIYDFWENMAKSKRWENYSNNVNNLISPYHHLNNSAETLRRYLEDAGFIIDVCQSQNCCFTFATFLKFLSKFSRGFYLRVWGQKICTNFKLE